MRTAALLVFLCAMNRTAASAATLPRVGQPAPENLLATNGPGPRGYLVDVSGKRFSFPPGVRTGLRNKGWELVVADTAEAMRSIVSALPVLPTVLVIDAARIVRRIESGPEARDPAALAEEYESGRAAYSSACARCHGDDGTNDSYLNIKPLRGIGARLTRQEIASRLNPLSMGREHVSVRGHLFTKRHLEVLVIYVAGL